jgi:hypothetical protein
MLDPSLFVFPWFDCCLQFWKNEKKIHNRVRTKLKFVFGVCDYLSWPTKNSPLFYNLQISLVNKLNFSFYF